MDCQERHCNSRRPPQKLVQTTKTWGDLTQRALKRVQRDYILFFFFSSLIADWYERRVGGPTCMYRWSAYGGWILKQPPREFAVPGVVALHLLPCVDSRIALYYIYVQLTMVVVVVVVVSYKIRLFVILFWVVKLHVPTGFNTSIPILQCKVDVPGGFRSIAFSFIFSLSSIYL